MRTIYTIILQFIFLLMLSSCQQDEVAILNAFLYENYKTNEQVLQNEQEEYQTRCEERLDAKNPKLDSIYTNYRKLSSQIAAQITSEHKDMQAIQHRYEEVLKELTSIVQHNEKYSINRIITTKNTSQLDSEYQLRIMRNNLVMAMYYAFEYVNKPPNDFQKDIAVVTQVDSKVLQINKRTIITLADPALQLPLKNRYVFVDRVFLNDSEIDINPEILKNGSFATITFDSLQSGKYYIQGKGQLHDGDRVYDLPFLQKFEVR